MYTGDTRGGGGGGGAIWKSARCLLMRYFILFFDK
jgi:hypothetical protein